MRTIAESLIDRGMKKGLEEGTRKGLEKLLKLRFGAMPASHIELIRNADIEQLDAWSERVLSAVSIEDVFG